MTSGFASEFPSNSHKSKAPQPDPAVEPKVVEQVTEGKVTRRKQSLGARFTKMFIVGEADSVLQHVLMEVLLPGARDMVVDGLTEYVERMIYGEKRSRSRGARPSGSTGVPGYVNYSRFANQSRPSHEAPRAGISAKARATHNFDEIVIDSRPEAMLVIDKLAAIIDQYGQATVADFYELVGETGSFADRKWGWDNIRDADIQRVRDGYLIRLPMPIDLKV